MKMRNIIIVAFCLSGMSALMYEVVWTRPLSLIFGSTVYAVSTMLTAFMAGLALGSYLISRYVDKIKNLPAAFGLLEMGIGVYAVFLIMIFSQLPSFYISLYNTFHTSFYLFSLIQFILLFGILLIPTTLMGATFPIVTKFYNDTGNPDTTKVGKSVGIVYSANTFGAIIGSFSAGFILIPLIGIQNAIIFTGVINILVGSSILLLSFHSLAKKVVPVVVLLFLAVAIFGSYDIKRLSLGSFYYTQFSDDYIENSELLFYKDSLYGTVSVLKYESGGKSLHIDGKSEGGTSFTDIRTNYLMAYIPLLLHKNPKNSLNIGLGTGTTSGILSKYVRTKTVEIDSIVAEASEYFKNMNKDVLNNPNHELVIEDARSYLLLNEEKYDIIVSEPSCSWKSSSSILFSKEFYEIVKGRLNENGIFAQWVPIFEYSVDDFKSFYNTFQSVFPHIVAFGNARNEVVDDKYPVETTEIILVGSEHEIILDWDGMIEKVDNSEMMEDLFLIRLNNVEQFKNLLYFTSEEMEGYGEGYTLITDDNPILEFSSGQIITTSRSPKRVLNDIENYLVSKK